MIITYVIFALVLVGISAQWCGDRAGEDAAHPAGSVRHQQRHGTEASNRPAEESGQTLPQ